MRIRQRDFKAVSRLWGELSEFPASHCDEALAYCLEQLTHVVGARNASWMGAIRALDADVQDPMQGWRPADIRVLHDAEEHEKRNEAIVNQFETDVIDVQSAAMIELAGETRALLRAALVDDAAWKRSWLYQDILRPLRVEDRLVGSYAVSPTMESYFALDRGRRDGPFDERARDVLHLFISGCPGFHREQLRARGLLGADTKLSPRERSVLKLLLTDLSEKEIADELGLTFNTTHQYVVAVFRKFGARGRASLVSQWLRCHHQGRPRGD